jgi:serine/threonine protein kinase/WD40 repeat protein
MPSPSERKSPAPQPHAASAGDEAAKASKPSSTDTNPHATASNRLPTELPAPFGRYRLRKLLGQGGMGAVYLAHDPQLDRVVALKVPLISADDGPAVLERFYREARAAATVQHPNVCPIYEVGEADGVPYLTMAYIEGKPLVDFVASRPLTSRQSVGLARKLALALQEAHQRGVIHRDLKPANIMIDRRGEPIIMDFGLARRLRQQDTRLTQEGSTLGTPAYMSPEQVAGKVELMGPTCDIYSLGVILYELLTGRLPFTGDAMAMLSQVLTDEPPPPSKFRPDIDPDLEAICLKAMAKKPSARYRSMGEMAAALLGCLRGQLPALEPPPPKPAAPEAPGIRVSAMGGLRSIAQLPVPLAPSPKTDASPRKQRKAKRKRRLPPWVWVASTAGAIGVLLLIGWIVYRATDYGTIQIEPSQPGIDAALTVDGNPGHHWGESLRLRAGEHDVVIIRKGHENVQQRFTVHRGANSPVHVLLATEQRVAAAPPGDGVPENGGEQPGGTKGRPPGAGASDNGTGLPGGQLPGGPSGRRPMNGGPLRVMANHGGTVWAVAISRDSRQILSAAEDYSARLWNLQTGKLVTTYPTGSDHVQAVDFAPDGRFALVGTGGTKTPPLGLSDLGTGKMVKPFKGHTKAVSRVLLSADGKQALSGSWDNTVRLWDVQSARELRQFTGHTAVISGLAFCPDRRHILTCSQDKTLRLWEIQTGKEVRRFVGHTAAIGQLSLSPNGRQAVSGGFDNTVRLWDVASGRQLGMFQGHTAPVRGVAFLPDGKRIISCSQDQTVRIWAGKGGPQIFSGHTGQVLRVAVSPDGQYAVTGSADHTVRLWQLPVEE